MNCLFIGLDIYKQHIETLSQKLATPQITTRKEVCKTEVDMANSILSAYQKDPKLNIISLDKSGFFLSIYLTKQGLICARASNEYSAYMTKSHNNATVLCLSPRITGLYSLISLSEEFLKRKWEGARHKVRTDMLAKMVK